LLPLSKTGPKATRLVAIQAITVAGTAPAVPMLVELLGDTDAAISRAAQDGLAAIANPAAPAAITRLLTSSSVPQRIAGIELAGRRKMTSAVPTLLKATGDPEESVRFAALKRLGELGSAAELPPLLQRLVKLPASRELELAGEAATAICVRSGDRSGSAAAVIRTIPAAAPAAKATLLSVLGAIGGAEALETVRLALSDSNAEVHKAAVQTLAEWPDATAISILVQVVSAAPDSSERDQAFSGLIRITRESNLKNEEKVQRLNEAATMAKTLSDKRLVLAGFGDIPTIECFRALVPYLSESEVVDDASASLVRIAGELNASFANEITPVLLQVVKVAKSEPVREKARGQIEQLIRNAAQKS
jgi:HEAT repeat protein